MQTSLGKYDQELLNPFLQVCVRYLIIRLSVKNHRTGGNFKTANKGIRNYIALLNGFAEKRIGCILYLFKSEAIISKRKTASI